MTFRDPELNRLSEQILNQLPGPQAGPPPRDPRAAMTNLLRANRRQVIRRVSR